VSSSIVDRNSCGGCGEDFGPYGDKENQAEFGWHLFMAHAQLALVKCSLSNCGGLDVQATYRDFRKHFDLPKR